MLPWLLERVERALVPTIESTPISLHAANTLNSWGMNLNQRRELQKIVGQFENSYANCLEKIKSLETVGVRGTYSDIEIILPAITENIILNIGGNCADIAHILGKDIRESGLLEKLKEPLELRIVLGGNRTHFKNAGHVWLGIVKTDNTENMVVLDGAYQEISHLKSNGYRLYKSDLLDDIAPDSQIILPWSLIDMRSDGITVEHLKDRVLGLSEDKTVSFSVGFAAAWNHVYVNIPFIRVTHQNGSDEAVFMVNPKNGELNCDFKENSFSLTTSANLELHQLLEFAQTIKFVDMQ